MADTETIVEQTSRIQRACHPLTRINPALAAAELNDAPDDLPTPKGLYVVWRQRRTPKKPALRRGPASLDSIVLKRNSTTKG
jgi:hypothetical protein